ncbi:hypothetical protein BAUR9175_01026 [Brevibacterium aurantiacum]|uniref:Uncharacterized protein n=1 Tax=Brevibacterium aurantiacum TaxID=273384 RepID=A0A2H1I7L1_BREAU|nr:hypothetical protein BAUR9175_01026 [Brevibacterium aurantiacum]
MLAVGGRVKSVVFAGAGLCCETDSVSVECQVDVNRCSVTWRVEHFLEAERVVERDSAVDVTREQNDLWRPEEVQPSILRSPGS